MSDLSEVEQYLNQLNQVEEALKCCTNATEEEALLTLKQNLTELLALTIDDLNEKVESEIDEYDSTISTQVSSAQRDLDSEMNEFMSQIEEIDNVNKGIKVCSNQEENQNNNDEENNLKIKNMKEDIIGKKCSAPHVHSWGSIAYHNAVITGIDFSKEYDLDDLTNICVSVMFTNPTHKEMIPCSFYLNGECRFNDDKCHFSHGELIPFTNLKDYHDPDFSKLEKNCLVLAKMEDKLWRKGIVLSANFDEHFCRVRIDQGKKEMEFTFEDLLPMASDEDNSSDSSSDEESETELLNIDDNYTKEAAEEVKFIGQNLLSPKENQKMCDWEKHTKGIGSKLMQKMGYVIGTGLGSNGEGIIAPISVQILPPGRSLDYCMNLREMANGDVNLFSAERKFKKEQKRAEQMSSKQYDKEVNKTDMFSFLNQNILNGTEQKNKCSTSNIQKPKATDYKDHSLKYLNVESVKIADDIRKKEKEISKLNESIRRHTSGSDIHKKLQATISIKDQELDNLRKSEYYLFNEQSLRKNKKKLDTF